MNIPDSSSKVSLPVANPAAGEIDPLAKFYPYIKPVVIGIAVLLIGFIIYGLVVSGTDRRRATQWDEFMRAYYETMNSGSPDSLTDVSERFPNTRAGAAASQVAGDLYSERALNQFLTDRDSSKKDLERARDRYQAIVDSNMPKELLMYQQAKYSLAYVTETLGDAAMANEMYREFVQNYPNSPFKQLADRGLMRCNLAKSSDFFGAFAAYNFDVLGPAPGEALPEVPDIQLPQLGEAGPAEGGVDAQPAGSAPSGAVPPPSDKPAETTPPSATPPGSAPESPPAPGGQ